jgi:hypothetical protein
MTLSSWHHASRAIPVLEGSAIRERAVLVQDGALASQSGSAIMEMA